MKRIKSYITLFLVLFIIFPFITNAATELSASTQNPIVGDVVYIQLEVNYGEKYNIRDFHSYIEYDSTYLELEDILWIKIRDQKGTTRTENNRIYVDKTNTNWESGPVLQMKFRVLRDGFTELKVRRNGESYYTNGDVIAQTTAPIAINSVKPSDNKVIGSLEIEGYTIQPTFSKTRYNYNLTVPSNVTYVNVKATKGDSKQSISGTGRKTLQYGPNRIRVVVTAQDKTSVTYEIMVNRIDNRTGDTTLKDINVTNTGIEYEPNKTTYEAIVSKSIDKVFVTGKTTDPNATIVGTGSKKLEIGMNTFELKVVSSGGKEQIYTFNITRSNKELTQATKSSKLNSLVVNNRILDLTTGKQTFIYGVSPTYSKLSINASPESQTAKVEIEGNEKLKDGINKIIIRVTEENEEVTEYILLVYKQPSKITIIEDINNPPAEDFLFSTIKDSTYILPLNTINTIKQNNNTILFDVVNAYNGLLFQAKIKDNLPNHNINVNFKKISESPLTYETELPKDTEVTLYLEGMYVDKQNVKIYSYEDNSPYTLVTDGVTVIDGYITFKLNGQSKYIITTNNLISEKGPFEKLVDSYKGYFIIGIGILILFLVISQYISKKSEEKELNEPLY